MHVGRIGKLVGISVLAVFLFVAVFGQPNRPITKTEEGTRVDTPVTLTGTGTRPFAMGFSQWPPSFDLVDIKDTYAWNAAHADIFVYHQTAGIPWQNAYDDAPFDKIEGEDYWGLVRAGMPKEGKRYLALTPLDTNRTGLAPNVTKDNDNATLPKEWSELALNDPKIKRAYLNYVLRAIKYFQPDYLAISIEPNIMLTKDEANWEAHKELYLYIRGEVKKRYPTLPIFASLQYENYMGYTSESKDKVELQRIKMQSLLEASDIIGVSTYPYFSQSTIVPKDYFLPLAEFHKPIAIVESGYASVPFKVYGWPFAVSEELQKKYFEILFASAHRDKYIFIINWISKDYTKLLDEMPFYAKEFARIWVSTGLRDAEGNVKPAYYLWETEYLRTLNREVEPQ